MTTHTNLHKKHKTEYLTSAMHNTLSSSAITSYICNTGRRDLPDMYAQGRTAPEGECEHIPTTHVTLMI